MKKLTAEHVESLLRYGFDQDLFEEWQHAVSKKHLSTESNVLTGQILAPEAHQVHGLPNVGAAESDELAQVGGAAIAAGELGAVILNGGMATRFGGVVKGVVEVLGDRSFLALKMEDIRRAQDAHGGRIEVYVMNSFATEKATIAHFLDHDNFGLDADQIHHYTQFVSVRMQPNGHIFLTDDGDISPHGPGHGDCIPALRAHGCLRQFIEGGGKHLFVSNVDNLGARVDARIVGHHIRSEAEATVELAPKWPGDVGGAPYVVDGRLQLVEQLCFPEDFDPDIVNVFNTNTFHFRADALDRDFDLRWYLVKKTVEGRPAVQIERLIGELTHALTSNYIQVKRSGKGNRFFPVKTPEDLDSGREEIAEMYAD